MIRRNQHTVSGGQRLAQVLQSAAFDFLNSEHPPQPAADKELHESWPEPTLVWRNKDVWLLNDDIIHGDNRSNRLTSRDMH